MSTFSGFNRLIRKGRMVICSKQQTPVHIHDANPDGKGGYISKDVDVLIHDQEKQKSKIKRGPGWQRGSDLL